MQGFPAMSQSLLLLLLLLFQLSPGGDGLNFTIVVVSEIGLINSSLIDATFNRYVNYNWRLLPGHSVRYRDISVSPAIGSATEAVQKICSDSSAPESFSGLIAIGGCRLVREVSSLAGTMQLPFVGIPAELCSSPLLNDKGVVAVHRAEDTWSAAIAILRQTRATSVAVIYDSVQDTAQLQALQSSLSSRGISSLPFQLDAAAGSLADHLTRLVKRRVFRLLVAARPSSVMALLAAAAQARVVQQNYLWLLVDTGITQAQLVAAAPTNSNIMLLRGGGLGTAAGCPDSLSILLPACQVDWLRARDLRFVDAVESIVLAIGDELASGSLLPSNASCRLAASQAWSSGNAVQQRLLNISNRATLRGIISYDSATRHFNAYGLELVGTRNNRFNDPVFMLLSGTYQPNSNELRLTFREKGQQLAFPNQFLGFKNATLILCSPPFPPFIDFLGPADANGTYNGTGIAKDIYDILAAQLDFRFYYKLPADGQWGGVIPGSPYMSGCVGEVQKGISDMGGNAFAIVSKRQEVIDYSVPLYEEKTAIILPRPQPPAKLWNVIRPLQLQVWLAAIGTLAAAALFTWAFARFSPLSMWNLGLEFAVADEVWLQEYIWSAIGSFLQQGQDFYPTSMSARTTMVFWWCFTVIIYASYTGDLTSALTVSVETVTINSLDDLVSQSAVPYVVPAGTNWELLFRDSNFPTYKKVAERMRTVPGIVECGNAVFTDGVACISDYAFLLNIANQNCSQVYLAQDTFNTAYDAFVLPYDAYYGELFNYHLQKLKENGVVQGIFNKYFVNSDCVNSLKPSEADAINLEGSGGAIILLSVFYLMGLIILGLELLWNRALKKQPLDLPCY